MAIRCKFFDDDGRAITPSKRCPIENCAYAHPEQPEWRTARRKDKAAGVRCKWYDDDGRMLDGGCMRRRHGGCPFKHPQEDGWAEAKRESFAESSGSYRRKQWQPPSPNDPKLKRLAAERKASSGQTTVTDSGFNPSSWGKPAYEAASPVDPGPVATASGRKIPPPLHKGGAWGSSYKVDTSGWGEALSSGAQGSNQADSIGWGESYASGLSNGWGVATPPRSAEASGGGWGATTPPQSSWGWVNSDENVQEQSWKPSSPRGRGSLAQSNAWDAGPSGKSFAAATAASSSQVQPAASSSRTHSRNASWNSAPPITPTETMGLPLRKPGGATERTQDPRRRPSTTLVEPTFQPPLPMSRKGKEVDTSIHRHPSSFLGEKERTSQSSSVAAAGEPMPAAPDKKVISNVPIDASTARELLKTPQGRKHIYRGIMKELVMVISLSIEREKELNRMMKWKEVRRHQHYIGMSSENYAALDELYSDWMAKCKAIDDKRREHLTNLLAYPELPTQRKTYDVECDWEKIKEYSKKLSQWMKELNLGQRLKLPQFEPEAPPEGSQDQVMRGPQTAREEEWSIERLSKKLDEMLALQEELEAVEPIDLSIEILQCDDKFIELNNQIQQIKRKQREKKVVEVLQRQQRDLDRFEQTLKNKNQEASDVLQKMKAMEDYLAQLRKQTEEMNKTSEEDEEAIATIEAAQTVRQATIDSLGKQIRELAEPLGPPTRPRKEIDLQALAAPIRERLIRGMKDEIIPVLEAFVKSTTNSAQDLQKEIDKFIDPLVETTNRLVKLASEEDTSTSASSAPAISAF